MGSAVFSNSVPGRQRTEREGWGTLVWVQYERVLILFVGDFPGHHKICRHNFWRTRRDKGGNHAWKWIHHLRWLPKGSFALFSPLQLLIIGLHWIVGSGSDWIWTKAEFGFSHLVSKGPAVFLPVYIAQRLRWTAVSYLCMYCTLSILVIFMRTVVVNESTGPSPLEGLATNLIALLLSCASFILLLHSIESHWSGRNNQMTMLCSTPTVLPTPTLYAASLVVSLFFATFELYASIWMLLYTVLKVNKWTNNKFLRQSCCTSVHLQSISSFGFLSGFSTSFNWRAPVLVSCSSSTFPPPQLPLSTPWEPRTNQFPKIKQFYTFSKLPLASVVLFGFSNHFRVPPWFHFRTHPFLEVVIQPVGTAAIDSNSTRPPPWKPPLTRRTLMFFPC